MTGGYYSEEGKICRESGIQPKKAGTVVQDENTFPEKNLDEVLLCCHVR